MFYFHYCRVFANTIHSRDDKFLHLDKFHMFLYSFLHNGPDYILKKYRFTRSIYIFALKPSPLTLPDPLKTEPVFISGETVCYRGWDFFLVQIFVHVPKFITGSDSSTAKHSTTGVNLTGPQRWPLWRVVPWHSRCGTLKNPQCLMAISAEHRSKYVALIGNDGDVSRWVENSRVAWKPPEKQTNKHTKTFTFSRTNSRRWMMVHTFP